MLHSRIDRVSELLKEEIGAILDREVSDPLIPDMVTVHTVKVTKDLRAAEVFVTFLNDDDPAVVETAVKELNKAAGYIRSLLGGRVALRYLPALHFHYNPSTRYAAGLERMFHEIDRDRPPEAEGSGSSGDSSV